MYSKDLKEKAINLYYKFKSFRQVEHLLKIGKSTLHRWVNNITFSKPVKLNNLDDVIPFISKCLDNNKYITIKDIKLKLYKKFNHPYSYSFIYTIIKNKLKYSYKKVNNKFYYKSMKKLKIIQKQFSKFIKNIPVNKIISIDETYLYTNFTKNYGWSKIGFKLTNYKKANPIKYSILMAISNKKIINYEIYKTNINKDIYYNFIFKLNELYTNHYFLMDNVSFHKSKKISDLMQNSYNELLYIPPYSPEFNPIEFVFSQFKRNLINLNQKNIFIKIKKSLKLIKQNHLENYYKNCFLNEIDKNYT